VRREAEIINPSTGLFLELDIWIPSLKICFEFQVFSLIEGKKRIEKGAQNRKQEEGNMEEK
jgi:hypothetical protein